MSQPQSIWSRLGDLVGLVATPLAPSHYLGLVQPLAATHALYARVESVWDETADARTLTLRPGRGWRPHRAGQHVLVTVAVDGRMATRTYSISSAAGRTDGRITITVKAMPGGRVSRHLVRELAPGEHVSLGLPQGDFVLPEVAPAKSLFVTAGSGITPVMSMLRTLAARGPLPDIVHLHYAPSARDVIFADELAELAATHPRYRLATVFTRQSAGFDGAALDAHCPDWRERTAWACGPASLLDAAVVSFAAAGRSEHLHIERFAAPITAPAVDGCGGRVRFSASRVDVEADASTPLLRVAEDAGVSAPHGCRMGICRTCDATLLSGCVRDLRTGHTIDEPGARVQVCVCAAAGDVELEL
jgi:ferredoxin-NADP reductase